MGSFVEIKSFVIFKDGTVDGNVTGENDGPMEMAVLAKLGISLIIKDDS